MNVKREIEDEDLVTCSQMVYGTFLQQKSTRVSTVQQMRESKYYIYFNDLSLLTACACSN